MHHCSYSLIFTGDLTNLVHHNEWEVHSMKATREMKFYSCCDHPYPRVRFDLALDRKPAFYVMTLLLPCVLTKIIAILGFLLPPESGEKLSLEITVLLALVVFLLIVVDQLPHSSDSFPFIGKTNYSKV